MTPALEPQPDISRCYFGDRHLWGIGMLTTLPIHCLLCGETS